MGGYSLQHEASQESRKDYRDPSQEKVLKPFNE